MDPNTVPQLHQLAMEAVSLLAPYLDIMLATDSGKLPVPYSGTLLDTVSHLLDSMLANKVVAILDKMVVEIPSHLVAKIYIRSYCV
jgi:hypothetical protein